jgi:glycosyltransferase involved in cell wall biosynthesis
MNQVVQGSTDLAGSGAVAVSSLVPGVTGASDAVSRVPDRALCFSVIINVYNGEAFLREAIDSVVAQSFPNWEMIIWDDRSTDRSPEICTAYGDPRIRYFLASEHTGIGAARSSALRQARGEWVAFLDQDDVWLPGKLAAQNALIEEDQSGRLALVYGRTMCFDERGRTSPFDRWHGPRPLPSGDIFAELLRKPSFIALSSVVFRGTALEELGGVPPDIVYCPDYYLCVEIARRYQGACVQESCCLYRMHPGSMIQRYRKEINEEGLRIIENAVGPSQRRILRTRRRVHETLIGTEEIRHGAPWRGIWRILHKGSLPYLAFRPLVLIARGIRNQAGARANRRELLSLVRSTGPLK